MADGLTFFSYSRTDSVFVLQLAKDLRKAGGKLWLDQLDIKAGSRWDASIEAALNASTSLIVILTPASIASNNVMDEVSYALENDKKVIPVLWKDCATPFRLRRLQRIDFTGDYHKAFDELLESIDQSVTIDKTGNKADPENKPEPPSYEKQKNQEDKLWEEACHTNTVSSYKKYIAESVLKEHTADANKIIGQLELAQKNKELEVRVWEKAQKENKINSYQRYLQVYPGGVYKQNALSAIAKLEEAQRIKTDIPGQTIISPANINKYKKLLIGGAIVISGLAIWLIIASTSKKGKSSGDSVENSYLFNNVKKEISKEFKIHGASVKSLVVSPDGKTILTGSWDSTARLSDLNRNTLQEFKGHSGKIFDAAFSPDGKTIITASLDHTARLWDLHGNLLRELKGHTGKVFSVNFSPDGKTILTGSGDHTARLWDLDGKMQKTFHDSDIITSTAFSPDGKTVLTGGGDQIVRLRDLEGNLKMEFTGHTGAIMSLAFSPDGKTIAAAAWDSTVRLWDLQGHELFVFKHHKDDVSCVAFSPNGEKVASASGDKVFVYDLKGNVEWEVTKLDRVIDAICFSPGGNQLLLGTWDGMVVFIP